MNVVFFGSSAFAVPSLRVAAARVTIAGVVTQPDRPSGRGHCAQPTPVKVAAQALGLPVHQPESLRSGLPALQRHDIDLYVLASYGKILPQALLDVPHLGSFNVHPSLLPLYRGATPIQTVLRDGAEETGVTIMLMDAGMDTGDIVLQERTPIQPEETYGQLHDRLAAFGAQALGHAIDLALSGHVPHRPQTGTASVTHLLRKEDLSVDWNWSTRRIVNTIRSLSPAPGAHALLAETPVKILAARAGPAMLGTAEAGRIVDIAGDGAIVRCADGTVDVTLVIPRNKGPQSGAAFARSRGAKAR